MGIKLDIVTAEKVVFSGEVDTVIAPGTEGELGILPHHAPLMATLAYGEPFTTPGLHVIASETEHWVENLTGFGGCGGGPAISGPNFGGATCAVVGSAAGLDDCPPDFARRSSLSSFIHLSDSLVLRGSDFR